jgi:hypothetical protein
VSCGVTLLLRATALLIVGVTVLAAALYACYMVVWMHAPAPQIVGLSTGLSVAPLLVAWFLLRLAERLSRRHPRNGKRGHA